MSSPASRFLLIARVGPHSLHVGWLGTGEARGFDVLLSAYDAQVADPDVPGVMFEHRPGTKVAGYAALFDAHAARIAAYDYVALFDDDLMIEGGEIARLFAIVAAERLKIAQPALSHDSHFTFAALLCNARFRLRWVNYIEMMCPVFDAATLQAVRPLFALGYESGIDLIWCNLVAQAPTDFAVIDAVTVRHTRPVGTGKAANGFTGDRRYEDDIHAILARFGLPWLSCVPFAGMRRDGSITARRHEFLWSALGLATAVPKASGWRLRARSVAVHWKHLIGRAARNIAVRWPDDETTRT